MVGVEIWKTGDGVITNGSKEAREAILTIYKDLQSGFQQVLEECSLKVAKTQDQSTRGDPTYVPFQVSKPPKLERPLSLINERQPASYAVVLLNQQRLVSGKKRKKIEWGNYEKKPDHHLDNIVNWIDLIKSPGNMSAGEFKLIAKEDPLQFPFAPFKPQKSYYYRKLIRDTMTSIDIDTLKNTLTRAYSLGQFKKRFSKKIKNFKQICD